MIISIYSDYKILEFISFPIERFKQHLLGDKSVRIEM